jgi:hypothetical protein
MELGPEVHAHRHSAGHRWVDLALALGALAVSITSIVIALENESAMRRLVTANSWPYLQLMHGNVQADGEHVIHFDVRNAGVGPATLEKLVVSYAGQPVHNARELLARCCGFDPATASFPIGINAVEHYVFTSHEDVSFLSVPRSQESAAIWDRLDTQRLKIDMEACYSSVFDEYWKTSLKHPKAVRVKSCDALRGPSYDEDLLDAQ